MALFKRKTKDKDSDKKQKEEVKKTDKIRIEKKEDKPKIKQEKKDKEKQSAQAGEKKSDEKKSIDKKGKRSQAYRHLIKPIVTEKVSFLGMNNQYVFSVAPKANKSEIKKAIELLYGVKPEKVNIVNMKGKNTRYGRTFGKRKDWKKAIITLKQGDRIEVYEGV